MNKTKGRKPISKDGEKMHNRNFRATDSEWAKCIALGGAFLRAKIKVAKVGHNVQIEGQAASGMSLLSGGLDTITGRPTKHPKCKGTTDYFGESYCEYKTTLTCDECKYGFGRKNPEAKCNGG
jgi:hypothetical protein